MTLESRRIASEIDRLVAEISGMLLAVMLAFGSFFMPTADRNVAFLILAGTSCFLVSTCISFYQFAAAEQMEDPWGYRRLSIELFILGLAFPTFILVLAAFRRLANMPSMTTREWLFVVGLGLVFGIGVAWWKSGDIIKALRYKI